VAEVVHWGPAQFLADRFRAKYGRDSDWGSADKYGYRRSPSPLCFFFYGNGVMPADPVEVIRQRSVNGRLLMVGSTQRRSVIISRLDLRTGMRTP
jgi:hypothetical protein